MPTPITETIRFGLSYEKSRLEAASYNLAIANFPLGPGAAARTKTVSASGFTSRLELPAAVDNNTSAVKQVYDPGNPYADAQGLVRYADIDPTHEMATLVAATRAYEANVRAFNTIHQMAGKAL